MPTPEATPPSRFYLPALFAAGIFGLIASPAMVFASRLAAMPLLRTVYSAAAITLLILGGVCCTAAWLLDRQQRALPLFTIYLFFCSVLVCIAALVLALLPDPAIFLATLTGALAAIVISRLEKLLAIPRRHHDRRGDEPANEAPRPPEEELKTGQLPHQP